MNREHIKLYYAYSEWANERILDAADKVTPEQLLQPNDLGWGSLLGGLVHILGAEWGWFNFLFGLESGARPRLEDFPTAQALRERWTRENETLRRCLDTLDDEDMRRVHTRVFDSREYRWVLWQALVHVVNHGTQHRSECAALLTGFGHSPGDMDFALFLYERYGRSDFPRADGEAFAPGDIELLFRYNDWANDRVLACAERLRPEQFTAANGFGWGSFRGTLTHLMDAEYAWRHLLEDGVFVGEMDPEQFADVAAIRARWEDERAALWRYLGSLGDQELLGTVSYESEGEMRYRLLWQCLAHLVNHGTQHRAECAALLTGFGQSPGNLDLTEYLSEVGQA